MDKNNNTIEEFYKFIETYHTMLRLSNEHLYQPKEIREKLPFVELKLSPIQNNIIAVLASKNDISVGEIAKSLGVCKQVVSQPINALVKHKILRRFQKEDNFRYTYIALTEYGSALLQKQREMNYDFLMEKFYSVASVEEMKKLTSFAEYYVDILSRFSESNINK